MKYTLLAFVVAFLLPTLAVAQVATTSQYDQKYLEMVKLAHNMPADFDFKLIREIYPKTSFYSPMAELAYKDRLFAALEKAKQGDQTAVKEAEKIADENFAQYKVHFYMLSAILSKYMPNEEKFHYWAVKGISDSMVDGKDGSSASSAIKVLSVPEEYFLIQGYFKGRPSGQELLKKNGRVFDVLSYTDTAGNKKEAYFDVSIPFAGYSKELQQKAK